MPNMGSFDRVALCAHALVHMLLCSVNIMKCLGTGRSSNSAAGQPQAIRPLFVFAAAANQAPGHTPEPRAGQATAATACDSDLAQGREPAGRPGPQPSRAPSLLRKHHPTERAAAELWTASLAGAACTARVHKPGHTQAEHPEAGGKGT